MTVTTSAEVEDKAGRPDPAVGSTPSWARPASAGAALFVVVAMLSFGQLNVAPFNGAPTAWLAVVAVVLVLLRPGQLLRHLARADLALVGLVALAPLSSLWSVDPALTMARSRVLIATTVVGLYLALRFDLTRQLRLLITALAVAALLSAVLLVVNPDQATALDVRGNAWQGAFLTKNVFGRAMSLGAIASACIVLHGHPRRRWPYLGVAGVCAVLVVVSWSKFALATTVLGLLVLAAIAAVRAMADRRDVVGVVLLAAIVGAVAIVGWLVSDPEAALGTLGRDATLTGRTGLWKLVVDSARERPVGGYGYGAFWQGYGGPSRAIWFKLPWGPPHAHNGLLDLWLNVGLVGAGLWLASLVVSFRRAVRALRIDPSLEPLWALLLLGFIALYNITEVTGPQNHLFWTLYVATSFSLGRLPATQRVRAPRRARPATRGAVWEGTAPGSVGARATSI
jgi:O-antigen ligase